MRLRQKLHFLDMALFYCQGFPMLILYISSMVYIVLGTQPLRAPTWVYMAHFAPYILAVEFFIWAMAAEAGGTNLFVIRRMWHGLMFVYMKAVIMALVYGPDRKPSYRVTRKNHVHRWYLRPTLPHILVVSALVVATIYGTMTHGISVIMRPDVVYWLLMVAIPLGSFIPLGWYGMSVRQGVLSWVRRPPAPAGIGPETPLDVTGLDVAHTTRVNQKA
jgi:cellulose synthase (UDP-forming)